MHGGCAASLRMVSYNWSQSESSSSSIYGDEDDYVITKKGESVKTHNTTVESVIKIALEIIDDPELYSRESISITKKE